MDASVQKQSPARIANNVDGGRLLFNNAKRLEEFSKSTLCELLGIYAHFSLAIGVGIVITHDPSRTRTSAR
jgi:hypothetical protein